MSLDQPVTPVATLRTHSCPVSCLEFHPQQPWLATGDEQGWIIVWSLVSRRPLAVWRPHEKSITALRWIAWPSDTTDTETTDTETTDTETTDTETTDTETTDTETTNTGTTNTTDWLLLSHARDNKIKVVRLDMTAEYVTKLPQTVDDAEYKQPWLVHAQDVNALNFCAVAVCGTSIAVPNTLDSDRIDIYSIHPQLSRPYFAIAAPADIKTGIVMALLLLPTKLVAGYESGHIVVYDITLDPSKPSPRTATVIYTDNTHKHPVLALAAHPSNSHFLSSSADSILAKHTFNDATLLDFVNTKHTGLASLVVRSDGAVFAIAGWDGMVRVFSYKTLKPLAAFKGAVQSGITSVAFNPVHTEVEKLAQTAETPSDSQQLAVLQLLSTRRHNTANSTHWLATGGKDGRIRLFNLY